MIIGAESAPYIDQPNLQLNPPKSGVRSLCYLLRGPGGLEHRLSHVCKAAGHACRLRHTGLNQPLVEPSYPFAYVYFRLPAGSLLELGVIRHVVTLVTGPPPVKRKRRTLPVQLPNEPNKLDQADCVGGSATHVECLSGDLAHMLLRQQEGVHQILHE